MKTAFTGQLGAGLTAMVCAAALATEVTPRHDQPASTAQQESPQAPKKESPEEQHRWLQQLAGEWKIEAECTLPGKAPEKSTGSETVRKLGEFWVVSEMEGTFLDEPVSGSMTLGYDAEKKQFVGTWVCDTSSHLWSYKGSLDPSEKILTLETEGPDPMTGASARFKDVIEIKDKDHRVLTSSMQDMNGAWTKLVTMTYSRSGSGGSR